MDLWAAKLVEEHKNPTVKLNFSRQKLLLLESSDQDVSVVNEHLDILKKSIDTNRVERRCARSKLKWIPEKHKACALTLTGTLIHNYGFQENKEKYFYPEETLFLLETNKIELLWNDVPMSLEQAYKVILDKKCDLNKYRAYKKLLLQGYKISKNTSSICKDYSPPRKRLKIEDKPEASSSSSKIKVNFTVEDKTSKNNDNHSLDLIEGKSEEKAVECMFKKLQEKGPKENTKVLSTDCDYFIYKREKREPPDGKLKFLDKKFNTDIGFQDNEIPNVYCYADDLSYFACRQVNLPDLF